MPPPRHDNIIAFMLGYKRDQHTAVDRYEMESMILRDFGVQQFHVAYTYCRDYKLLDGKVPDYKSSFYQTLNTYHESHITFRGLWALFLLEKHILFSL